MGPESQPGVLAADFASVSQYFLSSFVLPHSVSAKLFPPSWGDKLVVCKSNSALHFGRPHRITKAEISHL